MLHRDLVLEGFTATDWSRMLALFGPEDSAAADGGNLSNERTELSASTPRNEELSSPSQFVEDLLEAVCPNERAIVIGVFEKGDLWASLAFSRREGVIDIVLGKEALRDGMGLLSGDFRRDYRHLARAAENRLGDLALGCFAERETLEKLAAARSPGSWARAVAVRDVIISPFPPLMALPLVLDAVKAAMIVLQSLSERLDWPDPVRRLLAR